MYGETVYLEFPNGVKAEVFVFCSPNQSEEYMRYLAVKKLKQAIAECG